MSTVTVLNTRPVGRPFSLPPESPVMGTRSGEANRMVVEALSFTRAPRPISVEPREHRESVPVAREATSYWEDKGWEQRGQTYSGYFGSNGSRCPGTIIWGTRGLEGCYVSDPPRQLWHHKHRACFSHRGDGMYLVHFRRPPLTVDAAIMTVERVLNEAVRGAS